MTSVETKPVELKVDGAIATVTLNRPDKLNTFSESLMDNLLASEFVKVFEASVS